MGTRKVPTVTSIISRDTEKSRHVVNIEMPRAGEIVPWVSVLPHRPEDLS